jgi:hypothetical protein
MGTSSERNVLTQVEKYIQTAVQRDMYKYGRFPHCCCQGPCEDVIQEIHINLLESLGAQFGPQLASAMSAGPAMFKKTPEYAALTQAITRGIGRFRWTPNKRKQRGLPLEGAFPEGYEGLQPSESPLVDMIIDLVRLITRWSPLEQKVWHGRKSGKTIRQLEKELNLDFRRVAEMYKPLSEEITAYFSEPCGGNHKWPS